MTSEIIKVWLDLELNLFVVNWMNFKCFNFGLTWFFQKEVLNTLQIKKLFKC